MEQDSGTCKKPQLLMEVTQTYTRANDGQTKRLQKDKKANWLHLNLSQYILRSQPYKGSIKDLFLLAGHHLASLWGLPLQLGVPEALLGRALPSSLVEKVM